MLIASTALLGACRSEEPLSNEAAVDAVREATDLVGTAEVRCTRGAVETVWDCRVNRDSGDRSASCEVGGTAAHPEVFCIE
jgi:hypothetical protein